MNEGVLKVTMATLLKMDYPFTQLAMVKKLEIFLDSPLPKFNFLEKHIRI